MKALIIKIDDDSLDAPAQWSGIISIPKGSYQGNGEAILFLELNNFRICEKVVYIHDATKPIEFSNEYYPLQATISNWQAIVSYLGNKYDLVEAAEISPCTIFLSSISHKLH